jgi:hypothetical protein
VAQGSGGGSDVVRSGGSKNGCGLLSKPNLLFYRLLLLRVGGWVGGGRPRSLPTLQACEVSMGKFMSDSDYDRMPSTSGAGAVSLNSFRHGALSPRS